MPPIRIPAKLPEPRVIEMAGGQQIRDWHPEAIAFWREIRRSPMVSEYVQADLPGLLILADMVDLYWYGKKDLGAEIRLQRQCFGLTPLDRRRLQWTVQRVEDGAKKKAPPGLPEPQRDPSEYLRALG